MGVEAEIVLANREFFNTRIIRYRSENKIRFLIPCRNTDDAVEALRQYARRGRPAASRLEIAEDASNLVAGY